MSRLASGMILYVLERERDNARRSKQREKLIREVGFPNYRGHLGVVGKDKLKTTPGTWRNQPRFQGDSDAYNFSLGAGI